MTREFDHGAQQQRKALIQCRPDGVTGANPSFRYHAFGEGDNCQRCGITKQTIAHKLARIKSGRADTTGTLHFALIKGADNAAKSGRRLDALESAKKLLEVGFWPLWQKTPGRIMVGENDKVAVYLTGSSTVVARAKIDRVQPWRREFASAYPLILGGTPELVLTLVDVELLEFPISVHSLVQELDCVGPNKRKWGAAFCGGMRSLTPRDYALLTAQPKSNGSNDAV